MKGAFKNKGKKLRRFRVTDLDSGEAHSLKVDNVVSVEVHSVVHARIIYRDEEKEDTLRKIFTLEDCRSVIHILNGTPSGTRKMIMQSDIEQDIISKVDAALLSLSAEYEREEGHQKRKYEELYVLTKKHYQEEQVKFDDSQNQLGVTWRHRLSDWLYEKQDKAGFNSRNIQQKLIKTIYDVFTPAEVHLLVKKRNAAGEALADKGGKLQQVLNIQANDKQSRERAFEGEQARLISIRANPSLSRDCRGRLEQRIREYRLEHGDEHNFKFVLQPNGAYENIKSEKFKLAREQERQEREEKRSQIRPRRHGYSRSR